MLVASSPLSSSPLPRTPTPTRTQSASKGGNGASLDDEYLFQAPAELVCPLTLAPFIDPVLTTAGHVYERRAVQAHLEHSCTDPLTRAPLLNSSLTPVYVLRSRALEYRESAARACVERVCAGAPEPARYLRRAVELVADTGSHVQGLSHETVEYVLAHPSNAFDRIALEMFAAGLYAGGYRDRAAAIWSSLLLEDADSAQQAQLLRKCLSCWSEEPGSAADDGYACQKLVGLFERRTRGGSLAALPWDRLVELAEAAALGDAFVLGLCEQLLFRPAPPLSSAASGELDAAPSSVSHQEKRLLLKYVHVLTGSLQRRQNETERRLQELDRWRGGRGKGGGLDSAVVSPRGARPPGRPALPALPSWARHPALVAGCMFVTAALPHDHPAGRVLRAMPFLALFATN